MKNKKIFGIVVGIIVIIIAVVFIKDKTGKQTVKDENNITTVETTVIETTTETNTESVQKATVAGEKGTVADNSKNTVVTNKNGSSSSKTDEKATIKKQVRKQINQQRRQQRITIVRTANLQTIHMEVMDLEIIMLWIYLAMSLKQQRRTHLKQKKPQLQRRIIQEIPIRMTMVGQISINMVN